MSALLRPVPGHPGYVVAANGDVYGKRGQLLRQFAGTGGYLRFTTHEAGRWQQVSTHVMVCLAFHGPRPEGHHAAHRNGVRTDNRAENLRWATAEENEADKVDHDVRAWGSRHGMHKLTEDQVRAIRDRPNTLLREEAERYGVSLTTISCIRQRKTWRHI